MESRIYARNAKINLVLSCLMQLAFVTAQAIFKHGPNPIKHVTYIIGLQTFTHILTLKNNNSSST